jgi:hypothetical protein
MPRQGSAPAARQKPKPLAEVSRQLPYAEYVDARRSQFESQRHTVEPAANLQNCWHAGVVEREALRSCRGALVEQLNGRIRQRLGSRQVDRVRRKRQGGQAVQPFSLGAQRLSAGDQDADLRRHLQDCLDQRRYCANDVLAIVEHEQHLLVAQPSGQPRYRVGARQRDPQHGPEGARHQLGIRQRGEPDERCAVRIRRAYGLGDGYRYRGFADPARPNDAHKATLIQLLR